MGVLSASKGRRIEYARISVTDRCNYRCVYCMPEEGVSRLEHADVMRYEEIFFLCRVLRGLGVRKIRFTGGEPLVRRGMVSFLRDFREEFPDMAVALTTNAALLSHCAANLAAVGLSGLNISLDTVDPEKFRAVTRGGEIGEVIEGIDAAVNAGIPNIKTNTVLMRGVNDGESAEIMRFAWSRGITPRLIEFMPLGDDVWNQEKFIGAPEIRAVLSLHGDWLPETYGGGSAPLGPAKYYIDARSGNRVGIIEAVSNHFCGECNRLRVTAAGRMRACLFSCAETSLLPLLRCRDEEAVKRAVMDGISLKPDHWEDIRDGNLRMSGIGG